MKTIILSTLILFSTSSHAFSSGFLMGMAVGEDSASSEYEQKIEQLQAEIKTLKVQLKTSEAISKRRSKSLKQLKEKLSQCQSKE